MEIYVSLPNIWYVIEKFKAEFPNAKFCGPLNLTSTRQKFAIPVADYESKKNDLPRLGVTVMR